MEAPGLFEPQVTQASVPAEKPDLAVKPEQKLSRSSEPIPAVSPH